MSAIATKLLTFEEYAPIYGDRYYELVEGIPTEIPVSTTKHGNIAAKFIMRLGVFTEDHHLGRMSGLDNFVKTKSNPDTVRGADVSYYSFETWPETEELPDTKGADLLPDLIAEVNSASDRETQIEAKVEEYLQAGVKIVVVLDPETLSATVHRKGDLPLVFDNGDTLTFPDLVPGFGVAVKSLFGK